MLHVQRPKELLLKAAQWFTSNYQGMFNTRLVQPQNPILVRMVVAPENMQIISHFVVPSLSSAFKEYVVFVVDYIYGDPIC